MNPINDSQEENAEYPVVISLGKPVEEYPVSPSNGKTGPTKKKTIVYPCLYLSEIEGLDQIPNEGMALVYFRKKRVTEDMHTEGKEPEISIDLEIQELHVAEQSESESKDDMEKGMRELLPSEDSEDEASEPSADDSEESEKIDEEE